MKIVLSLLYTLVAGIIAMIVGLIALLHSFTTFLLCYVVLCLGGGFLLAYTSVPFTNTQIKYMGIVYAAFFPIFAVYLGPGRMDISASGFYAGCGLLMYLAYWRGATAKQKRRGRLAGDKPIVGAILCLLIIGCADQQETAPASSRLFVGPTFITNDPNLPEALAVLVGPDGRIERTFGQVPADTTQYEMVYLPGQLALPGLHDSHVHMDLTGITLQGLDLRGVPTRAELRARAADYIAAHPELPVVLGTNWDQSLFPDRAFPTVEDLEDLTDKPVFLTRVDGHAALANRVLLEQVGINAATPDPDNGTIIRDEDGNPTGVLVDGAMMMVIAQLPPFSMEQRKQILRATLHTASQAGIVAVHEMALSMDDLEALYSLQDSEGLPVRVFAYIRGDHLPRLILHQLRQPLVSGQTQRRRGRVQIMGIKMMIDGAMGSRGALLYEPYADQPDHRGKPAYDLDLQLSAYKIVQALGYQAAVHAIGDSANHIILSWIEGHQNKNSLPTRIEHSQLLRPNDFDRFARSGAIASMQPTVILDNVRWLEARLGPERSQRFYAFRTFLNTGVTLAFGSDTPVTNLNPALGFFAAQTRQDTTYFPPEGLFPEQRITFKETLEAYTLGAATAVGMQDEMGSLHPGKVFDLSVFASDPRDDPSHWLSTRPTAVVVEGEVRLINK